MSDKSKKTKIIAIVSIIIIFIILAILIIKLVNKENSNTDTNNDIDIISYYNKYENDVDKGIDEFMQSETYKQMSDEEKVNSLEVLLKKYEEKGIIKSVEYDSTEKFYTFEYNYGTLKGASGGILLKDFDSRLN